MHCLGNIAHHQGEWDTAVQYLTESVALWRQDPRTVRLARVLSDLAIVYTSQGAIEEAHTCLTEAYQLVVESPHELDKIRTLCDIGVAYYQQAAWAEATHAFHQANTPYLQNSPDLFMRATVANNLGNVLYEQQHWTKAEAYLRQAIPLWRAQNDDLSLGNSLGSLGKVLAAKGKKRKADKQFTAALLLLAKFPDNNWAKKLMAEFHERQQQL
ncbi:MAG: tetratricopeptide repeat protein [Chloroflexota bacterium]